MFRQQLEDQMMTDTAGQDDGSSPCKSTPTYGVDISSFPRQRLSGTLV